MVEQSTIIKCFAVNCRFF